MARTTRTPTLAEAQRRRAARKVWFAERPDTGMVDLGGSLPDVDGVFVKGVLDHMAERMRPAKGQAWDTRAHRLADALVEVCRHYADCHDTERGGVLRSLLVVQVPLEGPAEVAGIPLADEVVAELRAGAKVEPVLVDERNAPVAVGTGSLAAVTQGAARDPRPRRPPLSLRMRRDARSPRPPPRPPRVGWHRRPGEPRHGLRDRK